MPAPVALFVYNRPEHTRRTLESLAANPLARESRLYVFADGAPEGSSPLVVDSIQRVREIVREKLWCGDVQIIERNNNLGLADSIVSGIRHVLEQHEKVIVLEDDLLLSKGFLSYMNEALALYAHDEVVMGVSGYAFPVRSHLPQTYFLKLTNCWGWGTWKRAFAHYNPDAVELVKKIESLNAVHKFNLDNSYNYFRQLRANAEGRIKTWAVKWHASVFLADGLVLYPAISLVENFGHDGSGINCGSGSIFSHRTLADSVLVRRISLKEDTNAKVAVKHFFHPFPWDKLCGLFKGFYARLARVQPLRFLNLGR